MNTMEKAEPSESIHHLERFWKSAVSISNPEDPEKMSRRIQTIAKRYALEANAKKCFYTNKKRNFLLFSMKTNNIFLNLFTLSIFSFDAIYIK